MNRSIEIHDSVLAEVSFLENEAQLHFSPVYIHQSEGIPGVDAGTGWVQEATLHIFDACVEGSFSEFPVDLTNGQTQIGQTFFDNEIPVPLKHKGSFGLRLDAMWKREFMTLNGSGAELELLGEPEYVEEFRP